MGISVVMMHERLMRSVIGGLFRHNKTLSEKRLAFPRARSHFPGGRNARFVLPSEKFNQSF